MFSVPQDKQCSLCHGFTNKPSDHIRKFNKCISPQLIESNPIWSFIIGREWHELTVYLMTPKWSQNYYCGQLLVIKCHFSILCSPATRSQHVFGMAAWISCHWRDMGRNGWGEAMCGFEWFAGPLHLARWVITESWVNHACNHGYVAQ